MREHPSYSRYLLGIFSDEVSTLAATRALVQQKIPIHDVYTPYAVHGLDEAMGIRRSRLPIVTFIAGLMGLLIGVGFQTWVFTSSWPMNIGGKPYNALPAFIPVAFEMTVLIAGLTTVLFFFIRSKLYPGACSRLMDDSITDNGFVIAIAMSDASQDKNKLIKFFTEAGAHRVCEKEVIV